MMNRRPKSLRGRIITIVACSMAAMLLFQCVTLLTFLRENDHRKQEYVAKAADSIAASLTGLSQNLAGMGSYISNFEAFQKLYIEDRTNAEDPTWSVTAAFNTVRLMAMNFPLVLDVIVVSGRGIPFSFMSGMDYSVVDVVAGQYDFHDPAYVESKYVYLSDRDFFAYIIPISSIYTMTGITHKAATCIILCDKRYITDLIREPAEDDTVRYALFTSDGNLIDTNGGDPVHWNDTYGVSVTVPEMGISVRAADLSPNMDRSTAMFVYFAAFSLVILCSVIIIVILLLQRQIARPISGLVEEMTDWGGQSLRKRLGSSPIHEIAQLRSGLNNMLDEIETTTRRIFATQEKLYEMEVRKNETEIYALQNQINPHFLFNTLQCIRSIALLKDADEIAQISLSMSELFRYSMNYDEMVSIREELEIVRHYVAICNIRFQGRFRFEFQIAPEILSCTMNRMMLQPLVENSVMHGVFELEEGGIIKIRGGIEAGEVFLAVADNGPGFAEDRRREIEQELSRGFAETLESGKSKSYGLYNINRRLKLQCGERYGVSIQRENGWTLAGIRFPMRP